MQEEKHIDPRFFNSDTNGPFESCMVCHKNVLEGDEEYFIERIFRRIPDMDIVEPLFEYAMCLDCATQFRTKMSQESMRNMERFFRENAFSHTDLLNTSVNDRLGKCMVTGKDIDACSEFSYHAHCRGNVMLSSVFPFAISDEAMDQLSGLMSDQTLDELNDFKGKFFTGPPEVSSLINPRRFVLI